MATEEKSRDAFEPRKRYAAVGMQLGRVMLDDDFNEAEQIRLDEGRQVNLDVIGAVGSPDDGFKVVDGSGTATAVDFEIAAGTLYLGGLRLWNPDEVKFSLQGDWLQQGAADRPPLTPGRTDLVYVEAWQQPVTAVEDGELFEVALGGPDTSDRTRTMWRVRLAAGVAGDDCPEAWATITAGWAAAGLGTVNADAERVVDTKLAITYTAGLGGDLCSPAIAAGYLGAENQTIRVQLRERGLLTWGFDNAAPVYRATIDPADRRTITLLTSPRDEAHWPVAGQIVEVLPWSAALSNNEKLAELTGHIARVATSYTSTGGKLVLASGDAVPVGFGQAWKGRSDAATLGTEYVFVRVWNRGDDITSPPAIPYVVGTPLDLGKTGLQVTITGTSFAVGDHWVIAARPKTPDQVVPWDLESGRRVHGMRRFFAPLGLIAWNADGTFKLLHDCRPHFQPLTRLRGCCTYTVGDDVTSFGQFKTIQDAIDALPADGGKVCVLAGTYEETVVLWNKQNVTIEGCGPRSRIVAPAQAPWGIVGVACRDLAIRDLAVESGDAHGILLLDWSKTGTEPTSIADAAWSGFEGGMTRVRLEGLTVRCRGRTAIALIGGVDVTIRGCEIYAGPLVNPVSAGSDHGTWPAILSYADDLLVEENRIFAKNEAATLTGAVSTNGNVTYTRTALGGIQIGGGSRRVEIRRNLIDTGNGDGVTLGSWAWVADPEQPFEEQSDGWDWWNSITITINDEGCIEIEWDPKHPDPDRPTWVPVSMGDVYDVAIIDNVIKNMGKSGVGVSRFFALQARDQIIAVHGLLLRDNRIEHCVRLPIPSLPAGMVDLAAQGAVTLAEVDRLDLRGNEIRENGRRHTDPVCGVFALVSTGVVIENNCIVDNAPLVRGQEPVRPGWRGGVVLPHAGPPSTEIEVPELRGIVRRQKGEPAARISDNEIVVPEGRAIVIIGSGPMSIADNHLTTGGPATADATFLLSGAGPQLPGTLVQLLDFLGGVAVMVINTGTSNELGALQLLGYNNLAGQDLVPGPGLDARAPVAASGNILFADNQVNVDLLRRPTSVILSSVALLGMDDVLCADNQIEVDRVFDRLLQTVLTIGLSTRVQGNRVKETITSDPATMIGVSMHTVGFFMNMTTGNQTTRCITAVGLQRLMQPNQILIEQFAENFCDRNLGRMDNLTRTKLQGQGGIRVSDEVEEKAMFVGFDAADASIRATKLGTVRVQTVRASNATRELKRTKAVAPEDKATIALAERKLSDSVAAVEAATINATRARVEPSPTTADRATVHGLVLGKNGKPLPKAGVRLVDASGKQLGTSAVDDDGYFRVDVTSGAGPNDPRAMIEDAAHGVAARTGARPAGRTAPVTLEVVQGDKVVQRDKQPVRLAVGKQLYREVRVER